MIYKYDILIIGGGIIGAAIAKTIKQNFKNLSVALLEKEHAVAQHQTSHNSNVIHAGIYYKPNSLKSKLCVEGAELIYEYCHTKKIPYQKRRKLIIAKNVLESYRLKVLHDLAVEKNVPGLELLTNWKDVMEIQPNCKGVQALWSSETGNIDWKTVATSFTDDFINDGGELFVNRRAECIKESSEPSYPLHVEVPKLDEVFLAKYAVLCLGLSSGTLLQNDSYRNISLRVRYHYLNPKLSHFIRTNIYGLPHIELPFVGIHFSTNIGDEVLLGPSAFPALQMDGCEFDTHYVHNNLLSMRVGLLFVKNLWTCLDQAAQHVSISYHTSALKEYFPMISSSDISVGPEALQGQMVTNDGEFVDDFVIEIFEGKGITERIINCRFVPSPGATCALSLANMISKEMSKVFY